MSEKKSFASVMANQENGRRRVKELICFHPEMAEDYQALLIEAADAQRQEERAAARDPERAGRTRDHLQEPVSTQKFKAAGALVRDNPDAFYDMELEQLRRHDWLRLRTEQAPRDGHEEDAGRYNAETFPRAAVAASLRDPEPTDEVMAFLDDNLSSGEWNRLGVIIWNLNEGTRQLPKAGRLSGIPEDVEI